MEHNLMMVVGCVAALLLIFLLPVMGIGNGWGLAIVFGAMMLSHLVHFGMHNDEDNGEQGHDH